MIVRSKTFEDWMKANFSKGELRELADNVDAGWHGLTYYQDTCKLYSKFKDEIWEALITDSEEFGYSTVLEYIGTFISANVGDCRQFENFLVWYIAERTANRLTEGGKYQ